MRRAGTLAAVALAALAVLASPGTGRAAPAPCGKTPGLVCSQVEVPLDRTGAVPGTVSLHVETLPSAGTARGAIFLIAGGPGQGSAHVFDLGDPSAAALYRYMFPGYTLVAYDDRGTGSSGALHCPTLQASGSVDAETALAAQCAATLGAQRDFYSTATHAEDLEAVRVGLGIDKIALWGTSYGTKLALAYALAHPDHVERLLLDSVVPVDSDGYETRTLQALPATLRAFCDGGACRSATPDFAGDVVALANQLAVAPVTVKELQANGTWSRQRIDGLSLLGLVVDADLNPGLAAALPAAARAARRGSYQALVRLLQVDVQSQIVPDEELSSGLFAATVCHDGPFPWQPDTPVAERPALLAAAVGSLPAGSLGPFGAWAVGLGNAAFCLRWPSPSGGAPLGPGPLPDVPVLAVSGGFDMRTPTSGAEQVVALFPQGRLLVVPGVGHSVLGADVSFCSQRAVRDWILGAAPPATCARPTAIVPNVPAYRVAPAAPVRLTRLVTLAAVRQTLGDAEALWYAVGTGRVAGLTSGRLDATSSSFTLTRYGVAPGVALSGTLRTVGFQLPYRFQGTLTVTGASAATGVLTLREGRLSGTLAGKPVGA